MHLIMGKGRKESGIGRGVGDTDEVVRGEENKAGKERQDDKGGLNIDKNHGKMRSQGNDAGTDGF